MNDLYCEANDKRATIEKYKDLDIHEDYIKTFAINPVLKEILIAADNKLKLYSLTTQRVVAEFIYETETITNDNFSSVNKTQIKSIGCFPLMNLWIVSNSKNQLFFFTKNLHPSEPINLDFSVYEIIVSNRIGVIIK